MSGGPSRREPTRVLGRVSLVRGGTRPSAAVDEALQADLSSASALLQAARYGDAVELLESLIARYGTDPRITGRLAAARALFFQQDSRERQEQRASAPGPAPQFLPALPPAPRKCAPPAPAASVAPVEAPVRPRRSVPEGIPLPPPPVTVPLDEPLHEVETRSDAIAVFGPPVVLPPEEPPTPVPAPVLADVIPLHPRRHRPSPRPVPADEPLYIEHFRGGFGSFEGDDERTPTRERSDWHRRTLELPAPVAERAASASPPALPARAAPEEEWPTLALPVLADPATARARRPRAAAFMVAASLCSVLVAGSAVALVATRQARETRAPVTRVTTEQQPGTVLLRAGTRAAADVQATAERRARSSRSAAVAARTGFRLRVVVTPPEAEAVVTFRGALLAGSRVETADLQPGSRPETVTVTAPGFTPATLSVTLDRDRELQVRLRKPVKRMKLFPL